MRNAKDCILGKQIPNDKSTIWTVDKMKCPFYLANKFW